MQLATKHLREIANAKIDLLMNTIEICEESIAREEPSEDVRKLCVFSKHLVVNREHNLAPAGGSNNELAVQRAQSKLLPAPIARKLLSDEQGKNAKLLEVLVQARVQIKQLDESLVSAHTASNANHGTAGQVATMGQAAGKLMNVLGNQNAPPSESAKETYLDSEHANASAGVVATQLSTLKGQHDRARAILEANNLLSLLDTEDGPLTLDVSVANIPAVATMIDLDEEEPGAAGAGKSARS